MRIWLGVSSLIRLGCYKIVPVETRPMVWGSCGSRGVQCFADQGGRQTGRKQMSAAFQACRVQVVGGIAFATTAAGDFGPRELRLACEQTMEQLAGTVPAVYVADFRASTWLLRTVHLDALFDDVDPAVQVPAALVVKPHDFAMFRAHAWNVAQAGILRKVFTDFRRAVVWAQTRAALVSRVRTAP
jgi:hypothetical protein